MKPAIRRILVPTDFSAPSNRAFEYAMALAGCLGASINLVHVLQDPFAGQAAWEFYIPDSPEIREQRYQEARTRLLELGARAKESGIEMAAEVRIGNPTEEINAAAIDYGSDLIVMSTHGRTGLPHLLLGSIAERVLRTAPCPVIALRQALVEPQQKEAGAPQEALEVSQP